MKKQKAPIFPILFVIVLLGFIGYSQMPKGHPQAPTPDQQEAKAGDVALGVKKNLEAEKPKSPTDSSGPLRTVQTSSLLKMPEAATKPKPNPTSTASQWYEKNSAQVGG